jgi:hypothetical protein
MFENSGENRNYEQHILLAGTRIVCGYSYYPPAELSVSGFVTIVNFFLMCMQVEVRYVHMHVLFNR